MLLHVVFTETLPSPNLKQVTMSRANVTCAPRPCVVPPPASLFLFGARAEGCHYHAVPQIMFILLCLSIGAVSSAATPSVRLVTNVRDPTAGQVGCPYAQRCWMALELKGMPYEREEIDLRNKPEWFLRISPLGRVPALVTTDGRVVVESTVINEFLEDTTAADGGRTLLPADPWARAQQRVLVHRVDSRFVPAGFKYLCYGGDAEERAWQMELAFWDRALVECGGPFFGGAEMGLADVALAPFAERLEAALSVHRRQGLRDACREGQLGALERWLDLLWEVPAFAVTRCESAEAIARVYEPVAVRGMSYLNQ